MKIYHATLTGAVSGACLAFVVCIIKDLTLADTAYRMFILGIGGGWIGFLLSWLNLILPRVEHQGNAHHGHQQGHHT
jgi:hypothetical protein